MKFHFSFFFFLGEDFCLGVKNLPNCLKNHFFTFEKFSIKKFLTGNKKEKKKREEK